MKPPISMAWVVTANKWFKVLLISSRHVLTAEAVVVILKFTNFGFDVVVPAIISKGKIIPSAIENNNSLNNW